MIKLFSGGKEVKFTTTVFPDKTSQVWKLDENAMSPDKDNHILWLFENEAELFHVCQISQLCYDVFDTTVDLVCPYLPYGRQDKEVSNSASFALTTFKEILFNAGITRIETFDAHSKSDMVYPTEVASPGEFHRSILNHDFVCYPDKGAASRYMHSISGPFIYTEKVRNQLTGDITGIRLVTNNQDIAGKKILIIDDICDGGMTFIKVAEALKVYCPNRIDLAVSHGLFSKGRHVLHEAGISDIFTTNSLLHNKDGFKVW